MSGEEGSIEYYDQGVCSSNMPVSSVSPQSSAELNSKRDTHIIFLGKHYGVYSCEQCKGCLKRTVRNDLPYCCKNEKSCMIDRRQRNRCQYCSYRQCLSMRMKSKTVQNQLQETMATEHSDLENTISLHTDISIPSVILTVSLERILEAEKKAKYKSNFGENQENSMLMTVSDKTDTIVYQMEEWIRQVPHFLTLPIEDRMKLVKNAWNDLIIASFCYHSTTGMDETMLMDDMEVDRVTNAGFSGIFDERILWPVIKKMQRMEINETELACLKAIILLSETSNLQLKASQAVEILREEILMALKTYVRVTYSKFEKCLRFDKLRTLLQEIRSTAIKYSPQTWNPQYMFLDRLKGDVTVDSFFTKIHEPSLQ